MSWNTLPLEIRTFIREFTIESRAPHLRVRDKDISNPIILQMDTESRKHGKSFYRLSLPSPTVRNAYLKPDEDTVCITSPKIKPRDNELWKLGIMWQENKVMQKAVCDLQVPYLLVDYKRSRATQGALFHRSNS
ncbi:predicted protein [Botrytis cinerea T4]|uniref:Uncharacterized protein n=1 Tax=Botryotinia fuckeliana (strain T4) TaxID=999810 RepID=G2XP20_BOTF4|nr:predicted protein [Botrytis cinerea T4]